MNNMEYTVIDHWEQRAFVAEVNRHMEVGWVPHGGVAIVGNDGGNVKHYAQAMVRPAKGGAAT